MTSIGGRRWHRRNGSARRPASGQEGTRTFGTFARPNAELPLLMHYPFRLR